MKKTQLSLGLHLGLVAIILTTLTACGQKGPLKSPLSPPPPASSTASP